ncbi:hypothetical protein BurMR1_0938 [Burkholderia sp. MR1]|nr:hypothetical protein BurMR1_0938 [Burkholderia sp. MR1]
MTDRYCVFGDCRDGLWDDKHIVSLSALTLYFNNDVCDLFRALDSLTGPDGLLFNFRWLYRETALPGEPKLCLVVPLARNVTPMEYQRLCPIVSRRLGPRLKPVFIGYSVPLRLPHKGATTGFYQMNRAPEQALDPDWYMARAAD